ncbi:hypothetical protein [Paenibacillus taichungensis]
MNYIDVLLDVLKSEQELKLSTYDDYLDSVLDSIPGSGLVDFENSQIIETYFEPSSEEERISVLTSIAKYMNLMQLNSNGNIVMICSQIEAVLLHKITETGKLEDFNTQKQRRPEKSVLGKMCGYIMDKFYTFTDRERHYLSLLDEGIRPIRNEIVHEPGKFVDMEEVNSFVGDGLSLEQKLRLYHNVNKENVINLYNTAVVFFELCRKF